MRKKVMAYCKRTVSCGAFVSTHVCFGTNTTQTVGGQHEDLPGNLFQTDQHRMRVQVVPVFGKKCLTSLEFEVETSSKPKWETMMIVRKISFLEKSQRQTTLQKDAFFLQVVAS